MRRDNNLYAESVEEKSLGAEGSPEARSGSGLDPFGIWAVANLICCSFGSSVPDAGETRLGQTALGSHYDPG